MRAVRVAASGVVELVEVPLPVIRGDELLVHVEAVSLCATDRRLAARGTDLPRVPGHEIAGLLDDGTRVGIHPDIGCGRCRACRAGVENRCPARSSIGLDRDGGLAEAVAVPARHVLPVGDLDPQISSLLEPLACCLHAVRLLAVRRGDAAVVVGAGPMGILCTWALQAEGARVVVCQRSAERRRLAGELGANAVISPAQSASEALGDAPRLAIVTAPGAEALAWTLGEVAIGGTVHAFAGSPDGAEVDANLVHYRHLALVGSTGSSLTDYKRALSLAKAGRIVLDRLPRLTISLGEAAPALLADGDTAGRKIVVDVKGGACRTP